jgi:hypothetical protein
VEAVRRPPVRRQPPTLLGSELHQTCCPWDILAFPTEDFIIFAPQSLDLNRAESVTAAGQ